MTRSHRILNTAFSFAVIVLASNSAIAGGDCEEGCTPGYWKTHTHVWDDQDGDDYTQTIHHFLGFNSVMGVTAADSGLSDSTTLLDVIGTGGGQLTSLTRHAGAALASSDAGICYSYSTTEVIALYRDGIGVDAGPGTIASAKNLLESANELGCPLSNGTPPSAFVKFCVGDAEDCPCGNDDLLGGCVNSTGRGGVLEMSGSVKVADDSFTLKVSELPPNAPLIYFMAPAQARFPYMEGLFCVSATPNVKIFRLPPTALAGPDGSASKTGIISYSCTMMPAAGCITPGSTWNFQSWYRDAQGPCGVGANFTNAIAVTFK